MTTPTKKRVVKTPGQRLHHHAYARGKVITKWSDLTYLSKQDYESDAADLGIQPLTEDVPEPPKTDGELLYEAAKPHTICGVLGAADKVAAEFLRLLRERDGEPLEVTADMLDAWQNEMESCSYGEYRENFAAKINAHRGVRSVPQVTAEIWEDADDVWFSQVGKTIKERASIAADYLNAELAKLASQPPQPAPVAQPVERPEPVTVEWARDVWWNIPHADLTILVDKINAHFGAGKVGG